MQTQIIHFLEEVGCIFPQVNLLQPADPFLNTIGEPLRRRIFLTQNNGDVLCLRPEFTVPICLHHLKDDKLTGRYGYCGSVFRQNDKNPREFVQAGYEDFGNEDRLAADIECLTHAVTLLNAIQTNYCWAVTPGAGRPGYVYQAF